MSSDAILFRFDEQCVRVNKLVNDLVVCLSLSVSLLLDLSPLLSFKHTQHFLCPFFPAWRPLSLTFVILYYFPSHWPSTPLFLHTFTHQFFSPPPPVSLIKTQFGTVMGICTFDKKSEATCAIQGNLVLSVCNTCHVSLSV